MCIMELKKTILGIGSFVIIGVSSLFAGEGWMINVEAAKKVAKKENKSIFIEFTGSDWCPPCMMMDKEVFSKKEFVSAAQKDFVLVKIDVPRGDKALAEKNEKVVRKYNVRGFPTVVLLDSDGEEFSRFVASRYNSVEKMLGELRKQLRTKEMF